MKTLRHRKSQRDQRRERKPSRRSRNAVESAGITVFMATAPAVDIGFD